MNSSRGFSLLEIMIAMVVISIGIGVFLTVTSSNERKTNAEATGSDYALIVNDALNQFLGDILSCSSQNTNCQNLVANNIKASQYFSEERAISDAQKKTNTHLDDMTVRIKTKRSDDPE